jgi:hypothetical protein
MSELTEPKWGVISERGAEGTELTYAQAYELIERLGREGIYGRCLVTSEAASRMRQASKEITTEPALASPPER